LQVALLWSLYCEHKLTIASGTSDGTARAAGFAAASAYLQTMQLLEPPTKIMSLLFYISSTYIRHSPALTTAVTFFTTALKKLVAAGPVSDTVGLG
jgi:hypothetical protein